jgi:antitoxin PrlF
MDPIIKSSAKLSKRNQITVPKVVRDVLNVKPTEYLDFEIRSSHITVTKHKETVWDQIEKKKKAYHIDGKIGNPEIDWGKDAGNESIGE